VDFDPIAPAYAAHRRADPVVVAAVLDGVRPGRVLEAGSGTGNYAIAVHEATGADCTGIEPAREMLAAARGRSSAVRFVEGAAERLPFADGEFDVVFSVDVAHQVADFEASVRESFRVLRPGGAFVTVTDDEDTIRSRLHATYFPEIVAVELARYPDPARIRAALEAAGFRHVTEAKTESRLVVTDPGPHRDRAFSSLHLIPEESFRRGLERLERDLGRGPLEEVSRKLVVRARRPDAQWCAGAATGGC
jgi:ubiquinone/menaquinone biosynthesis C-methylase UbiE